MILRENIFLFILVSMPLVMGASSFLTAENFPSTFSDLSFTERIEVKRAGYEAWESEYDANGRCVTNCAYVGMTIETELQGLQRQTEIATARASAYQSAHINTTATTTTQVPVVVTPTNIQSTNVPVSNVRCTPSNESIPVGQTIPLGEPLIGTPRITSGFGQRIHPTLKKQSVHNALDFSAPTGTNIYSPAVGTIDATWYNERCGNGLRIKHGEGFSTVYCHLSEYSVKKGDAVAAGCPVAKTGNTGTSTGPHLHYEVHLDGKPVNPTKFINRK